MSETEKPVELAMVWQAIMGDPAHGSAVRIALCLLQTVPIAAFRGAIDRIRREATVGPLLNPSAYLDGRRWKNAEQYLEILNAARLLRRALPDEDPNAT